MAEYVQHAVISGDTIQAISQRYLDDAARWGELVEINRLQYPFLVDEYRQEDTPRYVKAIGEMVIVPIEDEDDIIKNMNNFQIKQGLDHVLGEDIAIFDFGRNVDLTGEAEGNIKGNNLGDLSMVKGLNNLKQALLIRFSTATGSLYHHPEYGTDLDDFIGNKDTYANVEKMRVEIERTARDDSRVNEVEVSEAVKGVNGSFRVELRIKPIGIDEVVNMGLSLDRGGIIEWD